MEDQENARMDKKMGRWEKGEEECPGVLQQLFLLDRPISVRFMYMNPTLIGWFRFDMF